MNTLSLTARLIAAAVAITLSLLGTVFAIAKLERADHPVATTIAVALASAPGGKITR